MNLEYISRNLYLRNLTELLLTEEEPFITKQIGPYSIILLIFERFVT
jgi:hypothetical protein